MILFCGNKILRSRDFINAIQVSVGETFLKKCLLINFNDGTSSILPINSKLTLIDRILDINEDLFFKKLFNGTNSIFRPQFFEPSFELSNPDPYLYGLALCSPIRNGSICSKRFSDFDLSKIENDYYSFELKEKSNKFYHIETEEGYPNLLKLEIKKTKNFSKLSERSIPDKYLFAIKSERESLIKGCMDMFGKKSGGETYFETCSYQLAKDFCFLIRSVGGFSKIRIKKGKKPYYIVSIAFNCDFNPFLLRSNTFFKRKNPRFKSIISVEDLGELLCVKTPLDNVFLDNFVQIS